MKFGGFKKKYYLCNRKVENTKAGTNSVKKWRYMGYYNKQSLNYY